MKTPTAIPTTGMMYTDDDPLDTWFTLSPSLFLFTSVFELVIALLDSFGVGAVVSCEGAVAVGGDVSLELVSTEVGSGVGDPVGPSDFIEEVVVAVGSIVAFIGDVVGMFVVRICEGCAVGIELGFLVGSFCGRVGLDVG